MELIDADALLGRHPRADVGLGTVAQLLSRMDTVGIDSAVVGHTLSWLHDPAAGNQRVLELVADQPRLSPAWVMLPAHSGETGPVDRFAAAALDSGVAAVRLYPADHGFDLTSGDCAPMLAALAEAGLPVLLDAGQAGWPAIEAVAAAHPDLPIVVGQVGYRSLRAVAGVLSRTRNVHIGLANMSSHCGLEWLVDQFGAERLIFGTGALERDPAEAVTRLLWSELTDEQVAAIGATNLRDLTAGRCTPACPR
ncbi:putative TIM-barrel fold metal-dependent hydrolase [Hamadaea flava]|uniref:Amidohydrolase family protein n=1 Tax=Hamadaea flava TaxID=1742688 RepID=A0ABV8LEE5_9ACTN|nr:amidohydrolase family protein [Hamadaea flava]MCP2329450.1 putative TIM-barrel fold metal-dependent hydrolase [Hamadaea flava]